MNTYLRIGDLELVTDPEASSVAVGALGHRLDVRLTARWPDAGAAAAAQRAGLVADYYTPEDLVDQPVEINFSAAGVLAEPARPTGAFDIEDGKHVPTHTYCYVNGVDVGLYPSGTLRLDGGTVGFAGRLKRNYEEQPDVELSFGLDFDAAALRLEDYAFTSVEEVAAAPPERVRRLVLSALPFATLPAALRRLTALEYLTLAHRDYTTPALLTTLPEWIGELSALREFFVQNCPLSRLPDAVADLRELRNLAVYTTPVTTVPAGVFRLPRLTYLTLSQNRLAAVPEDIDLPRARSIDLSGNRLATLPAGFTAACPELERLRLSGNAFVALPASLNDVAEVDIEVEVRQRLAPKPAQGGPYDRARYRIGPHDHARRGVIDAALLDYDGPAAAAAFLRAAATPAIAFAHPRRGDDPRYPAPTDYARLGAHRFGGLPDLPAGAPYPRFEVEDDDDGGSVRQFAYEFIAQLDCAALAPLQDYLPRAGFVYFFLSTVHDVYGASPDYPVALVQYHDVPHASLASGHTSFPDLRTSDYSEPGRYLDDDEAREAVGASCYTGFDASAKPTPGIPPSYSAHENVALLREALAAADLLDEAGALRQDRDDVLEEVMALEESIEDALAPVDHTAGAYGFSQHELPQTHAALALGGEPSDYCLLLECKSRGDMQWGDAGELHFVIHKGDLERRNFSRVWVGMYSS